MGIEMIASIDKSQTPIGVIVEVHGPVVVIACDTLPPLQQALCAHLDHETYLFEVHQHLDERHVRAITLHRSTGLHRGLTIYDTGTPLHIPVTPECLGRLLNIFGEPLDGGNALSSQEFRNIHSLPVFSRWFGFPPGKRLPALMQACRFRYFRAGVFFFHK
jgi:F-type H+-transporting ATPase subunit beta